MTSYNYEFAVALSQHSASQSMAQDGMPDITSQDHQQPYKLSIDINIHKRLKVKDARQSHTKTYRETRTTAVYNATWHNEQH